ncbi:MULTISPECIES: NADPH:quinone oxidoreductase family protein [Amycolatopsis]|uniref:NADPH:quinone reductase-like Zn-dependent oxidoreductase n=1 Tax=Amycolatopsis thermoflava TaxID=84480 RepID=A0A3N2H6T1_9PSEU|nr:NADPH:quinone oxidoreductase family protein [Amycolatopsis thermoflava]ROS44149.1 NADPH:quinone reductase-like Zn-dependent oxidoreductase [Amycolatopsis thermoflava]
MRGEDVRSLIVSEPTGPDALRIGSLSLSPAPGDVVIDVHTAGVTFPDLLLTHGRYQVKPEPPFAPGLEVAGVVRSAPARAGVAPGDRVIAFTGHGGGYAATVAVPAQHVVPIPGAMGFDEAVGLMVNYQTSYFGLVERGRLRAGETVLVHGAAGGVGTAAVQIARGLGARVLAVVSDEGKAGIAREAGAEEVILVGGWIDEVGERTAGEGVDLVYDPVGGDRFDASLRLIRPQGRILVIGFAEGRIPQIAANRLLLRNIDAVGVAWGHYVPHDPALIRRVGGKLNELAQAGHVRPLVGATYALEDGAQALKDLEARKTVGKSVLRLR